MPTLLESIDGNEAAARIAFKCSEVCIIYPITPSSAMGESADEWASAKKKNLWGMIPDVIEMQSEAGAAGAVHGALQTGALAATFTASQGLLLMIPNMYKIAGELLPAVFHVAARSLATHALSIFGDHSDVMATRSTGFAMLASSSVQEVMDLALVAHGATLEARIPFTHFFDGFRTSHEVNKIHILSDDDIHAIVNDELVYQHRARALSPDHPVIRGTAQNPDVFFQAREACNVFYAAVPEIVQATMDKLGARTGRKYKLYQYYGPADAERVIVLMGSGAETARTTAEFLQAKGEKVGVLDVHLFRPFAVEHFIAAMPKTVKSIAVLDRTKEPGAVGDPLWQDVVTSYVEALRLKLVDRLPLIVSGRYGLSSKEFTPAMCKAVFDELAKPTPRARFTVGIKDDVTHLSLDYDHGFSIEPANVVRCLFYGLGADGTVGANKNSIKIIGEETNFYTQAYFVYDSKKSGSRTVSHLRFGPEPIRAPSLIEHANFIGCHQFNFLEQVEVLKEAVPGATFLLNSPFEAADVWAHLPLHVQQALIAKKIKFYAIDAVKVAEKAGLGGRVNTIMQTCFFAISGVLPREEAIEQIKKAIRKSFGKKGEDVVQKNFAAVDQTLANLHQITVPETATSTIALPDLVPAGAPDFVRKVTAMIMAGRGDELPVSAMPIDGTFPTGTAKYEKRNIAHHTPVWDEKLCAQCGNCALVCPHGVIRMKAFPKADMAKAPAGFKAVPVKGTTFGPDMMFHLAISLEDCTGCTLCVVTCPVKNREQTGKRAINMEEKPADITAAKAAWNFHLTLPETNREKVDQHQVRGVQYLEPLFEFSGACGGCGETPYLKLLTQLFGDRAMIANATGCTSIYGGNLPTTPYTTNKDGRGPAWCNSLFEDNAEFGMGFRISVDQHALWARTLVDELKDQIGPELAGAVLAAPQDSEKEITAQRANVAKLKARLVELSPTPRTAQLLTLADHLVKRSIWIVGGDGWAYDIGYGGLDHVLASGRNVNILVLDTEVYSNTGGQASKSTPRGAVAKFAAGGKQSGKKDLAMMAMTYGNAYVARVAMGAKPKQVIDAFIEAEAYNGPSLIIAYSHCIAHGINMANGLAQQKLAVECGHWPLFRFNPDLAKDGQNPLKLDSERPTRKFVDYANNEVRYRILQQSQPEEAARLMEMAQTDVTNRWRQYEQMSQMSPEAT